jgi:diguanylate cyclase (GGDEF)-like protein
MSQTEVLLAILGVLVVANVLLVASIPLRTRRRRRSARRGSSVMGSPAGHVAHDRPGADEDARVAAAIEAFVTGASTDAPVRLRPLAPSGAIGRRRTEIGAVPAPETDDRAAGTGPELPRSSPSPEPTVADLADPAGWSRSMREESARVARFGHPVTVVMAELPRLDMLADRFGRGVAERVATETARLLVTDTRAADRIARLGDARFGVMLLETEEVAAAGYIDRVRAATDRWLQSSGLSIRLSFGSAGAGAGRDVVAAAADAAQRMHDADHGSAPAPAPAPAPNARTARPKNT